MIESIVGPAPLGCPFTAPVAWRRGLQPGCFSYRGQLVPALPSLRLPRYLHGPSLAQLFN